MTDNNNQNTNGEMCMSLRAVNKWFGQFHVLRDINLEVRTGEKLVICGPSGSGKSTLIRCINRLEEHQEGRIIVNGTELTDDLKHIDEVRREVGMVFQHFNLFPHLTVLQNLTLAPIWVRKTPKKEAEEAAMHYLQRVKIPEQADKYPGQLSGGQQQRVAIARSLCMKPKVMLFDEPTSALDPEMMQAERSRRFGLPFGNRQNAAAHILGDEGGGINRQPEPQRKRLLGSEGELCQLVSERLNKACFAQAIKQVGNYGEIYEANVGENTPLGLIRAGSPNDLWSRPAVFSTPRRFANPAATMQARRAEIIPPAAFFFVIR